MEPGVNSSAALLAAAACERALANASGWDAASLARAGCEHAPVLTRATATRAAVLAGLAALSLVANAATVVSIRRGQRERRCHGSLNGVYALILHLSVADLLVTVFCIGGEAAWSYSVAWLAGDAMCKVFKFLQMFCLYLSTFVLVLIGVDRFVVVRYPMRSLSAANRLNKLIALVWGLSLVLSVPQSTLSVFWDGPMFAFGYKFVPIFPLVIFRVQRGPFIEDFYQCVTYGFYSERWQEQLYTTFSLVCMFLLPLVILISTYVCTVITIARSERQFRAEVASGDKAVVSEVNRRRLIHRAKMKSLRISVVIVAAFIVWWTPYYIMMIIFMFFERYIRITDDLRSWIFFFGMSNSLVNPVIYGAFHLWQPRKNDCRRNTYSENKQSFRCEYAIQRRTVNLSKNCDNIDMVCDTHPIIAKNRSGIETISSKDDVNINAL